MLSCTNKANKETVKIKSALDKEKVVMLNKNKTAEKETKEITVLILPCANGYEYSNHGYNFNPLIEQGLQNDGTIKVIAFPYKKLKNTPYYGIFDKRYCQPIIEKTKVDFIIMTNFNGNPFADNTLERSWGYETKILNSKTMLQKKAIGIKGVKKYENIEVHIQKNLNSLKQTIKSMQ